jgi:glutamate--cysteine ligase catalytic subunit
MWIRQFVTNHPLYKHDSFVNDQIQYDLISKIQELDHDQPSIPLLQSSHLTSNSYQ